jgi:hypothetical protein
MSLLEMIGAFALFFIIVLVIATQLGWAKWTVERTKD